MARVRELDTTASSYGQFLPTTRQGEAMNLMNAKYGAGRGQRALYILDGLLNNETGKRIREKYADTGGFTDHVFAVTAILGHRFIPRIRDRTAEGQHLRIASLDLSDAIVGYWNTVRLGEAVAERRRSKLPVPPELLAHASPLGGAHILLTKE